MPDTPREHPSEDAFWGPSWPVYFRHRMDELQVAISRTAEGQQRAIEVALDAVAASAQIHATNHLEQHAAHERIHAVEKEALIKADSTMNKRLEGMNEFRDQLRDQAGSFVARELMDAMVEAINERMAVAENQRAKISEELASMRGRSAAFAVALAVFIPLFSIAMNILFTFVGAR